MSQLSLKLLAVVFMLTDHIGAVFFPEMMILRMIGRLSFPLFCFLLVEGALYSSHPWKYALRLLGTGVLSEPLFDLCFFGTLFYTKHQNVLFTLSLGLFMLRGMEAVRSRKEAFAKSLKELPSFLFLLLLVLFCMLAELFRTDYGFPGILLIFVFYTCYDRQHRCPEEGMINLFYPLVVILFLTRTRFQIFISGGSLNGFFQFYVQDFSVFALFLLKNYRGRTGRGQKFAKLSGSRLFYLVYPLSLLAIYAVSVAF